MTEKPMNDFEEAGRKATQKARETSEKNSAAAEETVRATEQSYSAAFENIRTLNVKLIDAAQANAEAVCGLARDIATSKTPSDVIAVWMAYAQKQFGMATKQVGDLTALGQKFATESTAPMAHTAEQAVRRGMT